MRRDARFDSRAAMVRSWPIGTAQAMADAGLLGTAPEGESEWFVSENYARIPAAEGTGLPVDAHHEDTGRRHYRGVAVTHTSVSSPVSSRNTNLCRFDENRLQNTR